MDFTPIVDAYLHVNNLISLLLTLVLLGVCWRANATVKRDCSRLQEENRYLRAELAARIAPPPGVPTMRLDGTFIPNGTYGTFTTSAAESTATLTQVGGTYGNPDNL